MKEIFPGIFQDGRKLYTLSLAPGKRVYTEDLIRKNGKEYRSWDPTRSKLSAAIMKGMKEVPIKHGSKVLYLGAATGTTPSHISDVVGGEGIVYCVEFSERAIRELLNVCKARGNMVPLMMDARLLGYGIEKVDVLYCDIAQPDQTPVAMRNAKEYLKAGGPLFLVVKSRSIDVVKEPGQIFKEEIKKLKDGGFEIADWKILDPYEKDHAMVLAYAKEE